MKTSHLTPRLWLACMQPQVLLALFGLLAFPAGAAPLAYEPFNYTVGELLCPLPFVPQRTDADGRYWISGTSQTAASDAAIVSDSLSYPGLAASTGNSMTNGSGTSQQSNRYRFGPGVNSDTLYVSFLMRVDSLGASFQGAPNQQGIITAMGYYNTLTPPTFIQAGLMWMGTNGVDLTSFCLGTKKLAATPYSLVQWATNGAGATSYYPTGAVLLVVQSYTFNTGGSADDVHQIWVNPDASSFGAATPPPSSATALADSSDLAYIDRLNFRQTTPVQTPEIAVFDELRIGTNWADVTPPFAAVVPQPKLAIALSGSSVVLGWPTNFTDYALFANTNLITTNWSAVTNSVVVADTNNTVTVDLAENRFFRLQK
jgi:hypothetical protein